jgi:hypothetical protein
MKKRAPVLGGIAILAIVLTTFFNGGIPGFGTGSGQGDGTTQAVQSEADDGAVQPVNSDTPTSEETTKPVPPKPAAAPAEVVQIVVEGDEFRLMRSDGTYRVAPISRIVKDALSATGNEDGIKVRILRKKNAKVVAWSTLENELEKSGIKASEILRPKRLVE